MSLIKVSEAVYMFKAVKTISPVQTCLVYLILQSMIEGVFDMMLTVVQAKVVQSTADLTQLASLYLPTVLKHCPEGPLQLAGVGMTTMLAAELSIQLQQHRCQVRGLIAAESVPVSLAKQAVAGAYDTADVSGEMLQTWCAMQQLITAAARPPPFSHPPIEEVIRRLHSLHSYEQQLDYISTFCPGDKTALQWDTDVDTMLGRMLHMRQLLLAYQPRSRPRHQTVLVQWGRTAGKVEDAGVADVQRMADDCWEAVAAELLPATACSIVVGSSGCRAAEIVESMLDTMV